MGNSHKAAALLRSQILLLGQQSLPGCSVPMLEIRVECAGKSPQKFISSYLCLFFKFNLYFSSESIWLECCVCLAVQNLLNDSYIYLFIFGSCHHVCFYRMLSRPPLVFGRCFVIIYFICIGDYIIHILYMLYVYIHFTYISICMLAP